MQKFTITEETLKKLETIHTDLNIIINETEASLQAEQRFTRSEVLKIIEMAREGEMEYDSSYTNADTQVEIEVETKVAGGYYETTYHSADVEVDLKDLFDDNQERFSMRWDNSDAEAVLEAWDRNQKAAQEAAKQDAESAADTDATDGYRPLTEEERAALEANLEETRLRLEENQTAE